MFVLRTGELRSRQLRRPFSPVDVQRPRITGKYSFAICVFIIVTGQSNRVAKRGKTTDEFDARQSR